MKRPELLKKARDFGGEPKDFSGESIMSREIPYANGDRRLWEGEREGGESKEK